MRRPGYVAAVLILALSSSSCMLIRKRPRVLSNDPVTLEVVNHNWSDIVIYALVDGTRTRLGDVSSSRTTTLKLPSTLIASSGMLQLLLDPLGSRATWRTGQILVNGGQQVRLMIENELKLSTWTVR